MLALTLHLALALPIAAPLAASPSASDTLTWTVLNHGRPAGELRVVTNVDTVVARWYYTDRNRGPRLESRYRLGPDGVPTSVELRGLDTALAATATWQRFRLGGDSVVWNEQADTIRRRVGAARFFRPASTSPFDNALLARYLLAQPGGRASILPLGDVVARTIADTTVRAGDVERRVRLVEIEGLSLSPEYVWLDERGDLFASGTGWFVAVPRHATELLPTLRAIELRRVAARAAATARRLTPARSGPLVVRGADLFDSETGRVRPRQSIVVEGERITAVGPSDSIRVPAGATVVEAAGRMVVPGLWDMHGHVDFDTELAGLMHLAAGVTTLRDMASDVDVALSIRDRTSAGTLIGPRLILAGFIEGPGAWAGPSEVLVRTEDEARRWVARYDSLGYKQIKLYNLVHPDLVPTIAAEAKRRGMRLSGHVPRGLTVPAAVQLGFDEINHAAFLFSTFFQDSLYVPRMRAYSAVAQSVAPTFDVDAPQVTSLIAFLASRGTVVDGTFNLWQDRSRPLADGTDAVLGPTISWFPAPMQRAMRPQPIADPQQAARAAASAAAYRRLLKRLYDAGVVLVPGTDNWPGITLLGELETYERAGIPAAEVLRIATIVPARVMKEDRDYGSVRVGKVADFAIVAGRPSERITDLRHTTHVVRGGRLFESAALWRAAGLSPSISR